MNQFSHKHLLAALGNNLVTAMAKIKAGQEKYNSTVLDIMLNMIPAKKIVEGLQEYIKQEQEAESLVAKNERLAAEVKRLQTIIDDITVRIHNGLQEESQD